jgi:hypothetical protein
MCDALAIVSHPHVWPSLSLAILVMQFELLGMVFGRSRGGGNRRVRGTTIYSRYTLFGHEVGCWAWALGVLTLSALLTAFSVDLSSPTKLESMENDLDDVRYDHDLIVSVLNVAIPALLNFWCDRTAEQKTCQMI